MPQPLGAYPPGGNPYQQSSAGAPPGVPAGAATAGPADLASLTGLQLDGPSNAVKEALAMSREPMPASPANYEAFGGKLPGEVLPGEQPRLNDVADTSDRGALRPTASTLRIVGANAVPSTATMGPITNTPVSATPPMQVTLGPGSMPANPPVATSPPPANAWNISAPTPPAATPQPPAASASQPPRAEYAFTPDYTSLSGRLEYSQASRQWKLRYIPIDGKTDKYGGSVVLPNSPEMAAYKPGDRVSVRGRLAGGPPAGSFSPLYQLERVERTSP
jgi:hypothetical protein